MNVIIFNQAKGGIAGCRCGYTMEQQEKVMAAKSANKSSARGWERKRANRDTYEEILEAAAKAFSKNGYNGTSLAEIAKAVGIKTPALYYHFKSKNEILYAYLVRSGENISSAVQKEVAAAGPDAEQRLTAFVKSYIRTQLEMIDTMPTVNTMIFSSTVSKALTKSQYKWIQNWERGMIEIIRDILKEGSKAGVFRFRNLAPTAFFIMGSIDFVVNWSRPDGSLSIDDLASEYADLSLASVKA
jgi:AcrR family transcriptional regulator